MMPAAPSRVHRAWHVLTAGLRTLRTRDFGVDLAIVQDGLDLSAFNNLACTMQSDPDGRSLLATKPRINLAHVDVDAFRALADGTLGREVLAHLETADLLRDIALPPSPFTLSAEADYAKTRWRETHDIRHVLTGLGVGLRDEVVLQAFQLGQYHNRFAQLQMLVGPLLQPMAPGPLLADYRRAYAMGQRARPLINVPWEALWARPVAELRVVLNVRLLTQRASYRTTTSSTGAPPRSTMTRSSSRS